MNEFMLSAVRTPVDDGEKEVTRLIPVSATDTEHLLNITLIA